MSSITQSSSWDSPFKGEISHKIKILLPRSKEEIYTEICSNNQAVRHMVNNSSSATCNNDMTTLPIGTTLNQVGLSLPFYSLKPQFRYRWVPVTGCRPTSPSTRGKAGRNHLNEEINPLLPTGIGERFRQTMSKLGHAALLRQCESPPPL